MKVIFILNILFYFGFATVYSLHYRLVQLVEVKNLGKTRPVIAEIFNFKYFEVIFHWRSSSLQAIFNFGLFLLS